MKTAVDKVKRGKGRIVNARFAAMCSHYLFDPDFCNVASGWEKGVVEKNVQDSRRRIWIEASTRRFGSFIELNAWLAERCRSVWADTSHPIHRQFRRCTERGADRWAGHGQDAPGHSAWHYRTDSARQAGAVLLHG
jgi:transposase